MGRGTIPASRFPLADGLFRGKRSGQCSGERTAGNFRPFDGRALGIFYREGGDVHMATMKKKAMKKKSMKKTPKKK
jgi:hypothetical protein